MVYFSIIGFSLKTITLTTETPSYLSLLALWQELTPHYHSSLHPPYSGHISVSVSQVKKLRLKTSDISPLLHVCWSWGVVERRWSSQSQLFVAPKLSSAPTSSPFHSHHGCGRGGGIGGFTSTSLWWVPTSPSLRLPLYFLFCAYFH